MKEFTLQYSTFFHLLRKKNFILPIPDVQKRIFVLHDTSQAIKCFSSQGPNESFRDAFYDLKKTFFSHQIKSASQMAPSTDLALGPRETLNQSYNVIINH